MHISAEGADTSRNNHHEQEILSRTVQIHRPAFRRMILQGADDGSVARKL